MRSPTTAALGLLLAAFTLSAVAADKVWVDGYTRDDGTYVRGHYRSAPDDTTANNFGPSQDAYERTNPYSRDYENDGLSNTYDLNDDNDAHLDDFDSNQYGYD